MSHFCPSPMLKALADTYVRYIELYLECVANKDNVSLLYHIAGKIKTVRSVELESTPYDPENEPNKVS